MGGCDTQCTYITSIEITYNLFTHCLWMSRYFVGKKALFDSEFKKGEVLPLSVYVMYRYIHLVCMLNIFITMSGFIQGGGGGGVVEQM